MLRFSEAPRSRGVDQMLHSDWSGQLGAPHFPRSKFLAARESLVHILRTSAKTENIVDLGKPRTSSIRNLQSLDCHSLTARPKFKGGSCGLKSRGRSVSVNGTVEQKRAKELQVAQVT